MSARLPSAVLFACDQNTVRSPIAEALCKARFGRNIYIESVGVRAGEGPDPFAVAVMAEVGIDLSHHKPKRFGDLHDTSFDWIVSLSPAAQHAAVELTRTMACDLVFWHTLEATSVRGSRETILDAYREVRDSLTRRIEQAFGALDLPQAARTLGNP
jgi:protein-tyrosine-phosphatase